MDTSTLTENFLTKQQVAETFGCSDRTVQRDISKLLKVKDDALSHLRLATDDEIVRLGTDVTVEVIEKLNHDGLKPRWYLSKEWAKKQYGQQAEPPPQKNSSRTHTQEEEAEPTRGGSEPAPSADREVVTLLREQIKQLEKHNQQLSQQLDNRSEREKETNVLIRDLHTLMAEMQNRLLPMRTETASRSESARQWSNVETEPTTEEMQRVTHDAVDAPTETKEDAEKEKGSPRSHSATRPATKKSSPSRKPGRRPATRKATKTTTKKKPASKEATTTAKYLPTFHKLYRSLCDRP